MSRLVTNPGCPIYPAPLPGWVGHQDLSIIPRLTILNKMLPHSILSASFLRKDGTGRHSTQSSFPVDLSPYPDVKTPTV